MATIVQISVSVGIGEPAGKKKSGRQVLREFGLLQSGTWTGPGHLRVTVGIFFWARSEELD